ncbi:MAG: tRNA lysidine(34) synthetase TilS, partial [Spirochaetales bacterium]
MSDKEKRDGNSIRHGLQNFISNHPEVETAGILVAYSGGIDSATLLSALAGSAIRPLRAVHVVHSLRPVNELRKEREVVAACCRRLHIPLTIATVKRGAIEKLASETKIGVEAAAREIRYGILKKIARRLGFRFIATAHNADDQLETLLGRFIASSSIDGLTGMAQSRDLGRGLFLVRPLLFASRKDIELYAEAEMLPISDDSTNAALNYTRNRIRHELVPILDRDFLGWRKGLLGTSAKIASDKAALNEYLVRFMSCCSIDTAKNTASIDLAAFKKAPKAIRIRALSRCIAAISKSDRMSYEALRDACDSIANEAPGVDVLGARIAVRRERLEILPILDFRIEDRYFFQVPSEETYHAGLISLSL